MSVRWLCRDLGAVPIGDAWLGPREQAVLAGLRVPKRRTDWRLGRWTAKQALRVAGVVGATVAPARVEICAGANGAPAVHLDGRPLADVALSLSHRDGVAVCAVAPFATPLGCDLERIERRPTVFVRDWFTPAEQAYVAAAPAAARAMVETLVWSAKESATKALGEGLRLDPREVAIAPAPMRLGCWLRFDVEAEGSRLTGWGRSFGAWVLAVAAPQLPAPPRALGVSAADSNAARQPARGRATVPRRSARAAGTSS